ncbi:response regulator [Alteromonas pelagimontana]|uniref:histidine kinase n=1 Tax=Alteromonas pelagimontana TaxID=1858656 RepID=A0A6M4MBX4_9ALTE|nr:ATP-binding protein [Alteromonas pelagimontana]QJR80643.1 response regulator [Alteromonas pelagimontana]
MRQGCIKVLFFILGFFFSSSFATNLDLVNFTRSTKDAPTGVLEAIVVNDSGIWLGGENGLYGLVGNETIHLHSKNTVLNSSYITDIKEINKNELLIAAYGDGLYLFNGISKRFKKLNLPSQLLTSYWKFSSNEDVIAITTINNVLFIDRQSFEYLYDLKSLGVHVNGTVMAIQMDQDENVLWWIDSNAGVYSLSLTSRSWTLLKKNKYFKNAKELSAIYVEKDKIYIGTDIGLTIIRRDNYQTKTISRRGKGTSKPRTEDEINNIKRNPNGKLWVSAEKLYEVNIEKETFTSPHLLYPTLAGESVQITTEFIFDDIGNLFALDSQKGLVILPITTSAVSFMDHLGEIFKKNIKEAKFVNDEEFIYTSDAEVGLYNIKSRSSRKIRTDTKSRLLIAKASKEITTVVSEEGEVYVVSLTEGRIIDKYSIPFGVTDFTSVLDAEENEDGEMYLAVETGSGDFLISSSNAYNKVFLSGGVSSLDILESGDLAIGVNAVGVYALSPAGKFRKITENYPFNLSAFTCLFDDGEGFYWFCTSGSGLKRQSKLDRKIVDIEKIDSDYIRGFSKLGANRFLVSTNSGLFTIDEAGNEIFEVGSTFGIKDFDFEYNGLVGSNKYTVVIGDNFNYILDNKKFIQAVESYKAQKSFVTLNYFSAFDDKRNIIVPFNKRLYEAIERDEELIVEYSEFIFEIGLTVTNYLQRNYLSTEYRLKGLNDEWIQAESSHPKIVYSSLSPGNYEFQARVVDPRSKAEQPVSSLKIRVLPPFWLTWQAFAIYGTVFLLFLVFCYRRYKGSIAIQGSRLSGMVNEKQVALEDSNSSIKRILQRKQTLFTNVSHELRTPLSLIIGPLEQIKESPDDAGNLERIDLIARNAKRLQSLVNQLLEIERLETIKELPKQAYDLDTTLPAIIANVKTLADLKQQSFSYTTSGHGTIHLLQDSLERILFNLVSNAVKYTAEGGRISVKVSCSELHLVITVSDNGVGMTEEEVKTVFNRFTRLQNVGDEDGVGIGLAVVKERVLANGGWVSVKSQPQQGSRFTVHLPMFETESPILQSLAPIIPIVEENEEPDVDVTEFDAGSSKPVVLIVEDNAEMRAYLHDVLRTDYRCATAKDGKHALEVARAIVPNLIVTDFMMPKMDGLELAKAVREHDVISHIPIVLLTARGDSKTLTESLVADVDCYLTKPVEKRELKLRVQNLLSLRNTITKSLCEQIGNSATDCEENEKLPDFANEKDQSFYVKLSGLLEAHYMEEGFNRTKASELMAMSGRQLHRKMDAMFDLTFVDYLKQYRLKKAKAMLLNGTQITQVAYDVGFSSPSYFSSCFKEAYGATPTQFLESGEKGSVKIGEPVTDSV